MSRTSSPKQRIFPASLRPWRPTAKHWAVTDLRSLSLGSVCVYRAHLEEAQDELAAYFARRGINVANLPDDQRAAMTGRFIIGDPDTVGERLAADLALGVDGFTINAPANGHIGRESGASRPYRSGSAGLMPEPELVGNSMVNSHS